MKAGEKAPEYLQDEVNNLTGQRKDYRNRRVQYVQEKVALKQQYTTSTERLKELISLKSPDTTPISLEMLVGKWRIREDVALDWNLDASGAFDSFFQKLGSHASSKSYGHWAATASSYRSIRSWKKTLSVNKPANESLKKNASGCSKQRKRNCRFFLTEKQ